MNKNNNIITGINITYNPLSRILLNLWLSNFVFCSQARLWVQVASALRTCREIPANCGLPMALKLRVRIIHRIITFCITATLKTGGAYYTRDFTVSYFGAFFCTSSEKDTINGKFK